MAAVWGIFIFAAISSLCSWAAVRAARRANVKMWLGGLGRARRLRCWPPYRLAGNPRNHADRVMAFGMGMVGFVFFPVVAGAGTCLVAVLVQRAMNQPGGGRVVGWSVPVLLFSSVASWVYVLNRLRLAYRAFTATLLARHPQDCWRDEESFCG
jgi:hypothetical protein